MQVFTCNVLCAHYLAISETWDTLQTNKYRDKFFFKPKEDQKRIGIDVIETLALKQYKHPSINGRKLRYDCLVGTECFFIIVPGKPG